MSTVTYTTNKLVDEAMALMGEGAQYKGEYMKFAVSVANNLLGDCFAANNAIRENKCKERLEETPVLKGEDDAIPYEYETVKNIMVYGMAYWLLYQDDELTKASVQNAIYEENKGRYAAARYSSTGNVLGGW